MPSFSRRNAALGWARDCSTVVITGSSRVDVIPVTETSTPSGEKRQRVWALSPARSSVKWTVVPSAAQSSARLRLFQSTVSTSYEVVPGMCRQFQSGKMSRYSSPVTYVKSAPSARCAPRRLSSLTSSVPLMCAVSHLTAAIQRSVRYIPIALFGNQVSPRCGTSARSPRRSARQSRKMRTAFGRPVRASHQDAASGVWPFRRCAFSVNWRPTEPMSIDPRQTVGRNPLSRRFSRIDSLSSGKSSPVPEKITAKRAIERM